MCVVVAQDEGEEGEVDPEGSSAPSRFEAAADEISGRSTREPSLVRYALPGDEVAPAMAGTPLSATLSRTLRHEVHQHKQDEEKFRTQQLCEELFAPDEYRGYLYRGYVDDARNTDNAWIETTVMSFHCSRELGALLPMLSNHEAAGSGGGGAPSHEHDDERHHHGGNDGLHAHGAHHHHHASSSRKARTVWVNIDELSDQNVRRPGFLWIEKVVEQFKRKEQLGLLPYVASWGRNDVLQNILTDTTLQGFTRPDQLAAALQAVLGRAADTGFDAVNLVATRATPHDNQRSASCTRRSVRTAHALSTALRARALSAVSRLSLSAVSLGRSRRCSTTARRAPTCTCVSSSRRSTTTRSTTLRTSTRAPSTRTRAPPSSTGSSRSARPLPARRATCSTGARRSSPSTMPPMRVHPRASILVGTLTRMARALCPPCVYTHVHPRGHAHAHGTGIACVCDAQRGGLPRGLDESAPPPRPLVPGRPHAHPPQRLRPRVPVGHHHPHQPLGAHAGRGQQRPQRRRHSVGGEADTERWIAPSAYTCGNAGAGGGNQQRQRSIVATLRGKSGASGRGSGAATPHKRGGSGRSRVSRGVEGADARAQTMHGDPATRRNSNTGSRRRHRRGDAERMSLHSPWEDRCVHHRGTSSTSPRVHSHLAPHAFTGTCSS